MEKKNCFLRVRSLSVLWALLAILLCAAPCGARIVASGETLNVGTGKDVERIDNDSLIVYGTVNLYPGAYVDYGIYALEGSTVNIYAGEIGAGYSITVFSFGTPDPVVTVHGTGFAVDGVSLDPSAAQFTVDNINGGVLTGTYENPHPINLKFRSSIPIYLVYPETPGVAIDIKPGGNPNTINLRSKGVLPVAVLSSETFDASTVNPDTVQFAGAAPVRWILKDVDDDGNDDMLFHFKTQQLNLDENSTEAQLTGETTGGLEISGTDEVRIVPPKK